MTRCPECGLRDTYNGFGDGIGSCDCPRCERCREVRTHCDCHDEEYWSEDDDLGP